MRSFARAAVAVALLAALGLSAAAAAQTYGMKKFAASKYGFSFFGRFRISLKKPIGLGVWVKVARPALCNAASSIPQAMPTDSLT